MKNFPQQPDGSTFVAGNVVSGGQNGHDMFLRWEDFLSSLEDASGMTAGSGITSGTGTIYGAGVSRTGSLVHTKIYIDLTGLDDGGTAVFIIGDAAAANCHIGQITTAINGTLDYGSVECLEAPLTGDPDINIYSATEATGVEGTVVTDLTETLLLNAGDWILDERLPLTTLPAADEYLYLTLGTSTVGTYTAGKFLIEFWGTAA